MAYAVSKLPLTPLTRPMVAYEIRGVPAGVGAILIVVGISIFLGYRQDPTDPWARPGRWTGPTLLILGLAFVISSMR